MTRRKDSAESSDHNRHSKKAPASRARQSLMLAVAVALLAVVAYINVKRFRDAQLPTPLPLPVEKIVSRPLATPTPRPAGESKEAPTRFTALSPADTGVDFTHPVISDHPLACLYFSSMASGGTAIGDINNDGRPDLFIASGPTKNRLFVQTETPFKFEDISNQAGIEGGDAWACGATMVDINADGRLDIYVANYDSPNALYLNLGDGRFKDVAWDYGLNLTNACLEATFADYDRDGFLDMYLVNYRYENPNGMPESPPIVEDNGKKKVQPPFDKYYTITNDSIGYGTVGRSDGLLRNMGNGQFKDVTYESGIHGASHGQSATWWDFNDDGFPDLHVGNDFNDPDSLYRNNGNGTFTDVVRETVPHITWFSMGADAGDLDGDGRPDLLTADMSSTTHFKQKTTMGSMGRNAEFLATAVPRQYMRNALLLNTGTNRFKEAAYLTNLDSTDWTWSVKIADLDCDGKQDVFFTNGSVRSFTDSDRVLTLSQRKGKTEWDIYKDTKPLNENNLAFRNQGDLEFEDVSEPWGLNKLGVSMSSAHADFDGDGDLDLVVANVDEPLTIYRNDTVENNRVTIRLHGRGGNRFGVGAKVMVGRDDSWQTRELQPSRGFLASNQPIVHFGLGDQRDFDLVIRWPSGGEQTHSGLKAGNHYEITEIGDLEQPATDLPAGKPTTWFQTTDGPQELAHHETGFDDYKLQPLLPHRMSRLGPAVAAADIDADGVLEYFIGGAAGQPGKVTKYENGAWKLLHQPALAADQMAEDMGAVWLDVENDGDVDLFVVSGGNEYEADADEYQLRLYLNDEGVLTRSEDRLPNIRVSGGPVSAADFDRDGDVDLFVGGRQVPGKYPLPAKSYLLVNEDGNFRDATQSLMPLISEVGMVTGSIWSDVDNDQDLDLLCTTEWGGIHLLRNPGKEDGNQFRDDSSLAGLSGYRGWWTGITAADLDNDGDMDFVATNMGLNTKYHANDEHPFRLFYGDFEGSGTRRLVEAEYEKDILFPVRGKSCSTHAMPSLANKFKTYKAFAAATLEDIYSPKCLEDAYECSANWLATSVLINDGTGNFTVRALPAEAQLAPAFGCVVTHLNEDEIPDIFLAQNFFSPQPETGNMDGGLGCLLMGQSNGRFTTTPTSLSGLIVPEDASAAVLSEMNGDGRPDFLIATNNDNLKLVTSQAATSRRPSIQVRLLINSTSEAAGARLRFTPAVGVSQNAEVSAGCGYLSQHAPTFFFSATGEISGQVSVQWPNGVKTSVEVTSNTVEIVPPE